MTELAEMVDLIAEGGEFVYRVESPHLMPRIGDEVTATLCDGTEVAAVVTSLDDDGCGWRATISP